MNIYSLINKKILVYIPNIRDLAKPWLTPLSSIAILLFLGACGYRITEGWDWGDCLWMVLITISTIGYGEIEPISAAGRIVTFLIIAGGLVVIQLTIQRLLRLSESGYFRRMRDLRFRRNLRRMNQHVILCGYGRIGEEIADQLQSENTEIIIIEISQARKLIAEEKGLKVLHGDATIDEVLIMAGITKCKSLVVTLPNNASNLYVVLSAKGLVPSCKIIARAESEEASKKLKLAGANVVVSPYIAAGRTMAATALRPLAVDFMDLLAGSNCEIEEFRLTTNKEKFLDLDNSTLSDMQLGRKSGAMILAIREESKLITNPGGDVKLKPGQLLIALGSKEELELLRKLFGTALINVEKMNS